MAVKTVMKPTVKVEGWEKAIAEMSRKMAESSAEADRKMAKSRAETDRILAESHAKTELSIRELKESQAETNLAIQLMSERIDLLTVDVALLSKEVREVMTGFSTIGQRFGKLVELVVIPGLRKAINQHGHNFTRSIANRKFTRVDWRGEKKEVAEVNLFLSNGAEAMAVEVKATLTAGYVNSHLYQLKKLRQYEKETNLKGKKLYGAVVGIYVDDDARKLARKNGLYVLEILEDEKKLKIDLPPKRGVW